MEKTYVCLSMGYMEEPVMMRDSGGFRYLDAKDLNVSSKLKEELQDWNDQYQNTLDHDDPMGSGFSEPQLEKAHVERGAELAKRLQEELGDGCLVDYKPIAPEK